MVKILIARPVTKNTMSIVREDGKIIPMSSTPAGFEYEDVPVFGEMSREGLKALTRKTAQGLRTLSFTQTVASMDYTVSCESVIRRFTDVASSGMRIRFTGGSPGYMAPCWWYIRSSPVTVTQLATNNLPSRAEIAWSLTEAVDVTAKAIRLPPPPKPKPSGGSKPVAKKPVRTHRVVPGDTLGAISSRYLGTPSRYVEIFNMNRSLIKNPNIILPGWVLKIPAK